MAAEILVIDPDEGICATLRLLLTDVGYIVTAAPRPEVALEHLLESPHCLVVLFDAGVPRQRGGQIVSLASADDPRLSRHAYICMTTSADLLHPDLHAALLARAVPIIEKPFDLDAMLAVVENAARAVELRSGTGR